VRLSYEQPSSHCPHPSVRPAILIRPLDNPAPCKISFLGYKKPKSTKKDFPATKGIEIGEFWIKKPNINHRV
jgi:hypothetical protein